MNLNRNQFLHFEVVNNRNRKEAEDLSVFSEQSGFIESVSECLKEADELKLWRPVGIYDGSTLIGFAMYGYFPEPAPGQLWLDRLLIDKKYQGKGYGKQAVLALLDKLRTEYQRDTVYLSVYEMYILVYMKIIPMQSSFINRLASTLMENTTPTERGSWYTLFKIQLFHSVSPFI